MRNNVKSLQPMERLIIAVVAQDSDEAFRLKSRFLAKPLSKKKINEVRLALENSLDVEVKYVLFSSFGLDGKERSREELARSLHYYPERIKQIYDKGMRKIAGTDVFYKLFSLAYSI